MKVIDLEPHFWFLLRDGEALFLDVNCSHSFVSYGFLLKLNDDETKQFAASGREFIQQLAESIQCTAPGVRDNNSPFKHRNAEKEYGELAYATITAYRSLKKLDQ